MQLNLTNLELISPKSIKFKKIQLLFATWGHEVGVTCGKEARVTVNNEAVVTGCHVDVS